MPKQLQRRDNHFRPHPLAKFDVDLPPFTSPSFPTMNFAAIGRKWLT
jgi:hypothetical protein